MKKKFYVLFFLIAVAFIFGICRNDVKAAENDLTVNEGDSIIKEPEDSGNNNITFDDINIYGTLTLKSGTFTVEGDITIYSGGTLIVESGSMEVSGKVTIGSDSDTQSGGTLIVESGSMEVDGNVTIYSYSEWNIINGKVNVIASSNNPWSNKEFANNGIVRLNREGENALLWIDENYDCSGEGIYICSSYSDGTWNDTIICKYGVEPKEYFEGEKDKIVNYDYYNFSEVFANDDDFWSVDDTTKTYEGITYQPKSEEAGEENIAESMAQSIKMIVYVKVEKADIDYTDYPEDDRTLTVYEGETLGDVESQLLEGFSFVYDSVTTSTTSVGNAGEENRFKVNYNSESGKDSGNYNDIEITIKVISKPDSSTENPSEGSTSTGGNTGESASTTTDSAVSKVDKMFKALGSITAKNVTTKKITDAQSAINAYEKLTSVQKREIDSSTKTAYNTISKLISNYYGSCGSKVYYCYFKDSKTLTIFGKGKMKNCVKKYTPSTKKKDIKGSRNYNKYLSNAETVIVQKGVTLIGNGAFAYSNNLKTLNIEGTNVTIGEGAFAYCSNLKTINMKKNSVKKIKLAAFRNCTSLQELSLPEGLKTLGQNVFLDCKKLNKITLPSSLKNIGNYCFYRCNKLKTVVLKSNKVNKSKSAKYVFYKTSSQKTMIVCTTKKILNSNFVKQSIKETGVSKKLKK